MHGRIVASRERLRTWGLVLGFWTLLALFFSSEIYSYQLAAGEPLPWLRALRWSLVSWYSWAALAPLVFWLVRRFSLERLGIARGVVLHVVLSAVFSLLHLVVTNAGNAALLRLAGEPFDFWEEFRYLLPLTFHFGMVTYWVMAGACVALDVYRRYREREHRASALESQLARARLQALRGQLHPHFLFNTLNTISALVARDPRAADRMIERLGDLLRRTLDDGGSAEVPLEEELRFLEGYLEIERTRFRDRLTVLTRIDPGARDARVPSLILQPLVENAIRHGIAPRAGPGRIEIRAERHEAGLRLLVQDDGPGVPGGAPAGAPEGVGLANTRARLRQLYGDRQRLSVGNAAGGGFEAVIEIPFQHAADPASAGGEPRAAAGGPGPAGGEPG
jgi:two-component sensor histidine kinase